MAVSTTGAPSSSLRCRTGTTGASTAAPTPNNSRRHGGGLVSVWFALVTCFWLCFVMFAPSDHADESFSVVVGVRADDDPSKTVEPSKEGGGSPEGGSPEAAAGKRKRTGSRKASRRRSKRRSKAAEDSEEQSVTDETSAKDDSSLSSAGEEAFSKPPKKAGSSRKASRRGSRRASRRGGSDAGNAVDAAKNGEGSPGAEAPVEGEGSGGGGRRKTRRKRTSENEEDARATSDSGSPGGDADNSGKNAVKKPTRRASRAASRVKGEGKPRGSSKRGRKGKDESKGEEDKGKDQESSKKGTSTEEREGREEKTKAEEVKEEKDTISSIKVEDEGKEGGPANQLSPSADNLSPNAEGVSTTEEEGKTSSPEKSTSEGSSTQDKAVEDSSASTADSSDSFDLASILKAVTTDSADSLGDSTGSLGEPAVTGVESTGLVRSSESGEEPGSAEAKGLPISGATLPESPPPTSAGGEAGSFPPSAGAGEPRKPGAKKRSPRRKHRRGHPKTRGEYGDASASSSTTDAILGGVEAGEDSIGERERSSESGESGEDGFSSLELWKQLARGDSAERTGLGKKRTGAKGRPPLSIGRNSVKGRQGGGGGTGHSSSSPDFSSFPPAGPDVSEAKRKEEGEAAVTPRRRRRGRRVGKDVEDAAKMEKRRKREDEERELRKRLEEEEIYDEFEEEFGYRAGGHSWLVPGPPVVVPQGSWPLRGLLYPDPDFLLQDEKAQGMIAGAARELATRQDSPVEFSELALRRAAGTTAEIFERRFPYGTRFTFQPRHGHSFEPKVLIRGRFIQSGDEAMVFEVWEGARRWALRLRMKHLQDLKRGDQGEPSGLRGNTDDTFKSLTRQTSLISSPSRRDGHQDRSGTSGSGAVSLGGGGGGERLSSLGSININNTVGSESFSPATRDVEAWEKFSEDVCNECEAQEKFALKILLSGAGNEQPRDLYIKERIAVPVAVGEIASLPMLSLLRGDQYITNVAGLYPLAQASVKDLVQNYDLPTEVKVELARQMVQVVARLHARGVVHLNLKLGHFLLDRDGNVFLADFSTAEKIIGEDSVSDDACQSGSLSTLSPEQLACWISGHENRFKPTMAVDSWGLGISLLELWCGGVPFRVPPSVGKVGSYAAAKYLSELHRRNNGRLDLGTCPEGDITHPEFKQLVQGLLAYQPTKRWLPLDIVFTSSLLADKSLLEGSLLKPFTDQPASSLGSHFGRHLLL